MAHEPRAVTYALKPIAFPPPKAVNSQSWATGGRRQQGFIAQEVEQVAPEVVAEDGNGYKTVAYSRLVPTLAAALSAALDRLDKLEESTRSAPKPAAEVGASSAAVDGSEKVSRSPISQQGRRATAVGTHEQQQARESDTGPAMFDLMRLRAENTALRGRVSEMEDRMVELERKLGNVASVGAATTARDALAGARARATAAAAGS